MALKLSDLKEASYNPRVISDKRLENLAKSIIVAHGDLSGVVFNKRTNTLISGHQRLKVIRANGAKTEIKTVKVKDKHGTVEEGYIAAHTENGTIRIPLRVVDWSDKRAEMAANIAANAHGGDFDRAKLGAILAKLEGGKKFDIDVIGLDPLSLRSLLPQLPSNGAGSGSSEGGGFQEFSEDSFEFKHTCPKCKFQFNDSTTSQGTSTKQILAKKKKVKDDADAKSGKSKKKKKKASVDEVKGKKSKIKKKVREVEAKKAVKKKKKKAK